jgi:deoxyribodipyrimidine photo-lyase
VTLLLTEEDLSPGWLLDRVTPRRTVVVQTTAARSPLAVSPMVEEFAAGALRDCAARFGDRLGEVSFISVEALSAWCAAHDINRLVTSYIPVGPTQDQLRGIPIAQQVRDFDAEAWPHATHGFFRFKEKIPSLIGKLKGLQMV